MVMSVYTKLVRYFCAFKLPERHTIYALSSAYGKCGVSIIRVSGPCAKRAMNVLLARKSEIRARHAHLKELFHPTTKELIDKGLVLWFPGPASFTGEDCCEFHVHGSVAVIAAIKDALSRIDDLQPAAAGEFSKRAFLNGKLDLTEVEGLADLIHAETEAQRKQALFQSNGSLSRLYDGWRQRLIRSVAHMEAYIDFGEEENIEDGILDNLIRELSDIKSEMKKHLNDQRQGELLREGVRTAIIGAPNVGKSSFLNIMCQREIAIVSDLPGTTRDIIEAVHNIAGYPVRFADTAGLRTSEDPIELQGIERAKQYLHNADLILLFADGSQVESNINKPSDIKPFIQGYLEELGISEHVVKEKVVRLVINKVDLLSAEQMVKLRNINDILIISCKNLETIDIFLTKFESVLKEMCGTPLAESPRLTHVRYRTNLERCIEHIDIFLASLISHSDLAISAQNLKVAIKNIGFITGDVNSEDVLNVIFAEFCVGK